MACTEMLDPYVDLTDLKNEVAGPLSIKKPMISFITISHSCSVAHG